jgi:hypothetical protein
MGVNAGASNDRTVLVDLFFIGYFFMLIPSTHTGTAIVTSTAILSSDSVFGTNPHRPRYLLYKKKINKSLLYLTHTHTHTHTHIYIYIMLPIISAHIITYSLYCKFHCK